MAGVDLLLGLSVAGAITSGISVVAQLRELEEKVEQDWARAFPNGPGMANSSIFERIDRVEQLVNYYMDKTTPSNYHRSGEHLKAAAHASTLLMNLELVRDLRMKREQAGDFPAGPRPPGPRPPLHDFEQDTPAYYDRG